MNTAMTARLTLDEAELILHDLRDRVSAMYGRLELGGESELATLARGLHGLCGDGLGLCTDMRIEANRKSQEFLERQCEGMYVARRLDVE